MVNKKEKLSFFHINVRSLQGKLDDTKNVLNNNRIDILAIGETWLDSRIETTFVNIDGYTFLRRDRGSRGGGVGLYISNSLKFKIIPSSSDIEQLWVSIHTSMRDIICGVVYRPPLQELVNFLDHLELSFAKALGISKHVFCLGDFNVDYANPGTSSYNLLEQFMENFEVAQLITDFTRVSENSSTLIDLILTTSRCLVSDSGVQNCHFSDHDMIFSISSLPKPQPVFKHIRNYKSIDVESFRSDLANKKVNEVIYIRDKKIDYLNSAILSVLDVHAPYKLMRFTKKPAPWLSDNLRLIMNLRDTAKKKFIQPQTVESWNEYKKARNFATQAVKNEKKAFFSHLCKNKDSKQIWRQLQNLNITKSGQTVGIPHHLKNVDSVNEYFIKSIPNVNNDNKNLLHHLGNTIYNGLEENGFHFVLATEEDIINIINKLIKTDAIGIDGINITLIKICYPLIKDALINIVNSCILSGYFPIAWKTAIIKPIPKKSEIEDYKDLRPISLLPTISKILEHILNIQIKNYLHNNSILPIHQSGFRSGHSCTTALLKITDDILKAHDEGKSSVLVMLDYSKAFDCLNPNILISMLHHYGFTRESLNIIQSYFSDRHQVVQIDGRKSKPIKLSRGVPQGSVLGPLLYSIYTSRIGDVVHFSNIHAYADDTQIYASFDNRYVDSAVDNINKDLDQLYKESNRYGLFLNPAKTKVIIFSPRKQYEEVSGKIKIKINGITLQVVSEAKNLGVTIDSKLRYKTHVSNCIQKAYNNLRQLYPIRHFLSIQLKAQLCNSLVLSHFTHASPVYGTSIATADHYRIQKVQNSCLRLIFGIRRFEHISHTFQKICWLNMKNRSLLHMLTLFHSIISRKEPKYLFEKIEFRKEAHSKNVRDKILLSVPYHKSVLYERSFTYSISMLYNKIPSQLKMLDLMQFKKRIRLWLYSNQISLM
nr:unnamed protein product [Callosobruchus chinensis]